MEITAGKQLKRKIRILLVTPRYFPLVGGASTYYKNFVVDGLKDKFEFFILTTNNPLPKHNIYSIPWFETETTTLYRIQFLWLAIVSLFATVILITKKNIDVVHIHTATGLCLGSAIAAWISGKPILKDLSDIRSSKVNIRFPPPDRLICLRGPCLNYARSLGIREERIISTPLPFERPKRIVQKKIYWPVRRKKNIVFLYLGEMKKSKGIYTIINLAKAFPEHSFILVGPPPSQEIRILVAKLRNMLMTEEVQHAEVFGLLKRASLLLLPSESEGIPRVVIEALSVGCPVIIKKSIPLMSLFSKTKGIFFSDFSKASVEEIIKRSNKEKIPKDEFRKFVVGKKQFKTFLKTIYLELVEDR